MQASPPPPEEGPDEPATPPGIRRYYLAPFRAKAETDYYAKTQERVARRGRRHETLVNSFAVWLANRGIETGRNAAIDLGIAEPPAIVEAKIVEHWASAIRQAVGQLYEYRFFQLVDPRSALVFLGSKPVPAVWRKYLECDREIGVAWPSRDGFHLTPRARKALGL